MDASLEGLDAEIGVTSESAPRIRLARIGAKHGLGKLLLRP